MNWVCRLVEGFWSGVQIEDRLRGRNRCASASSRGAYSLKAQLAAVEPTLGDGASSATSVKRRRRTSRCSGRSPRKSAQNLEAPSGSEPQYHLHLPCTASPLNGKPLDRLGLVVEGSDGGGRRSRVRREDGGSAKIREAVLQLESVEVETSLH